MKTLYNKKGKRCTADDDQVSILESVGWSTKKPKGKPEPEKTVKAIVPVDPAPVEEKEPEAEADTEEDTPKETPTVIKPRKIPKRKVIKKKE